MCGICGIVNLNDQCINAELLDRMTDALIHRGPDDRGILLQRHIGLGHRRLSIIDLSEYGKQPFLNEDRSIFLVMNGEVYNYVEIREWLLKKGHTFKGHSDNEVVLHGYEEVGIDILQKLRGMFAFALYDSNLSKLFLARDRLGEKPLYYTMQNGVFYFASELKSLMLIPAFPRAIEPKALDFLLISQCIPAPYSIFRGVNKVKPAQYVTLDRHGNITETPYWYVNFREKRTCSLDEAAEELRSLLAETVKLQMSSDVPVAALLSGGVDSSSVVSNMVKHAQQPVQTYSIGYQTLQIQDPEFQRSQKISTLFHTKHDNVLFTEKDLSLIGYVMACFDEPVSDFSALYSYMLLKKIKEDRIKVVLSGNGADEILLGYSGYNALLAGFHKLERYKNLERFIPNSLYTAANAVFHRIFQRDSNMINRRKHLKNGNNAWILAQNYHAHSLRSKLISKEWIDSEFSPSEVYRDYLQQAEFDKFIDGKSYIDYMLYAHHNVALIADITGMANSVEVRSPFLDHHLVEFAASLPYTFKIADEHDVNKNKYVLKRAMETVLPEEILYAPKMGFGYNIDVYSWIRGPWRTSCEHLLLHDCLRESGMFNMEYVSKVWDNFLHGQKQQQERTLVWKLIVFNVWYDSFIKGNSGDTATQYFSL